MGEGQDRTAATHALKIWPTEFGAVIDGRKRFEWRRSDRDYRVGDLLRLMEWDPDYATFTGSWVLVSVLYLLRGPSFEVPPGYCVLSISPLIASWRDDQRLMRAD